MRNLLLNLKKKAGFTLAELVVTTAVMGTLAAVAVPKFSNVNEMAKARKTMANVDNIISAAGNYFNEATVQFGRGRFPGQSKFNVNAGGAGSAALIVFDNADFRAGFGFNAGTETAGDVTLKSPYEDGQYMFYVIAGAGSGETATSPTIWVFDKENESDYSKSLTP